MQNAHLRLARLEYVRNSLKTQTHTAVHVTHFIGEGEQAHLLSYFGNDAEVGAVTAAIQENHRLDLVTPDGKRQRIGFGAEPSLYKANISLARQKRSLRHVVAISSGLHANGSAGRTILLNDEEQAVDLSWAALVSLQGLPAVLSWGGHVMGRLREDGKVKPLVGVGCSPVLVDATREELMNRIGQARRANLTSFPDKNGPISWPSFDMKAALAGAF
ncbi:hypothetical protein ACPOL_6199 [Acidisarcina polymorpha]|uniref:Uncharacterized protein n=1 Tax=Acidisarcina polymorpha TaxID=2211140 RepID=A0A2Z5G831_9BACT|nr:hypothetical protein [Acidisarcina polymorpha]AXC15443.1 hypothetical protein ACPOL_6199 [Acidisarcina polymorpha]